MKSLDQIRADNAPRKGTNKVPERLRKPHCFYCGRRGTEKLPVTKLRGPELRKCCPGCAAAYDDGHKHCGERMKRALGLP